MKLHRPSITKLWSLFLLVIATGIITFMLPAKVLAVEDGSLDTSFLATGYGADSTVNSLAIQGDGKMLIGGNFHTYNGVARGHVARLNSDGSLDTSFLATGAGAENTVRSLVIQSDGKILIGGDFHTYNGVARGFVARLNSDGSLDTSFLATGDGAGSTVTSLVIQSDGKILIGGAFTTYNGVARVRVARLNSDGSLDTSFLATGAGANDFVRSLVIQGDGKILIGGAFTTYNGVAKGKFARLNSDGSLDTTFLATGAGAGSTVTSLAIQSDGKILIGGAFTTYNTVARGYIARLNNDITAPVTTDNVSSSWGKTTVNVTLSCSDDGTGCANTYYTTDGTTPTTGSTAGTSFSLSAAGTYTIKYFSVDANGNTEIVRTAANTVKIDTTAPSGSSIGYINEYQNTTSVALTVSDGTDAGSGIDIFSRIFQGKSAILSAGACGSFGSFSTITPTGIYPNLIDSTVVTGRCYQYQYQVSDIATNQSTSTSSSVVRIDTGNPSAPGTPSSTTPTKSISQTWTFAAATDAISGIASYLWRTTGTAIVSGTSVANSIVTSLAEGVYNFFVKSVDLAGNTSSELTTTITIDTTAPVTTDDTSASWHKTSVTTTLSCTDTAGTGCATTYYTTNGDIPTSASSSGTSVILSSPGTYTIKYFSVDAVDNTESVKTASNQVRIDTVTPADGSISYTNGYYTSASVPLTVSDGTDEDSGIDTATRTFQRQSASLILGICGIYGSLSTITPEPTSAYPNFTDTAVVSGNCYKYEYQVSDTAGNQVTYTSGNVARIDTGNPSAPGTPSTTSPTKAISQSWAWVAATDTVSDVANYLWRTTGTAIVSGTSAVNSVVTSLTEGFYNFFVKSVDTAGNTGSESTSTVTIDTTAPTTTLTNADITDTSATINWTTNEESSALLEFGLTSSYGSTTNKVDVSPRTTSHTNSLTSLVPCSTYHYSFFTEDESTNTRSSADRTFTTLGCTNEASILSESGVQATVALGGTLNLLDINDTGLTLTIPPAYATEEAVFQAHQLEKATVLLETDLPTGYLSAGEYIYELKALTSVTDIVSTFETPLSITITYDAGDITSLEESSLSIWSWDGSTWTKLSNCLVDTNAKTVTCDTSHFSTFGLFGVIKSSPPSDSSPSSPSSQSPSSSSSSSDNTPSTSCNNEKPSSTPDLFQVNASGSTTKLFFTPISNTNTYYIGYSTSPLAEEYGVQVTLAREGVQNYTINLLKPNTVYYFKVRGQNGCTPGSWSGIMKVITGSRGTTKIKAFYKNSLIQSTFISIKTNLKSVFSPLKSPKPNLQQNTIITEPTIVQPITVTPNPIQQPIKKKTCFLWWCW